MAKKQDKAKQIELQNLIFGTEEKKLMVSPEFLDQMTAQYISKRMKSVNQMMEVISNTKSVKTFFSGYDSVITNLDELIALQKYHEFKKPIPSEFKKTVESKKDKYTLAMINRVWKNINMKTEFNPTSGETRSQEQFGPVLDEMLAYKERYTSATLDHIDRFYKSVYGKSMNAPDEPEPDENQDAEAGSDGAEDVPAEESEGVPEEDMKLTE